MTVRVTHAKASGKAQGTDATRVYGNHWDADHVVTGFDATGIDYTATATGAVVRTIADKLQESVSILDFGVSGSGAADMRDRIQSAIDATPDGGELIIPRATVGYLLDSAGSSGHVFSIVDKSITIRGQGFNINTDGLYLPLGSLFILGPNIPDTADIFHYSGTRAVFEAGIKDVAFVGATNAFHASPVGRHCVHFEATGTNDFYHQYFNMDNVFICNMKTGYSLKTTATAANNGGGALCNSKFKDVAWMCSKLDYVGDSITFDNITSGQNATDDSRNVGCIFNNVSGATSVRFLGGNWSNFNGTIICDGGVSPMIFGVEAELALTTINTHGSMIDMRGAIDTVYGPVISGACTISQNGNVSDTIPIRFGNTQDAYIGGGIRIAQRRVTGTHITITSGSSGARVGECHYYTNNAIDLIGVVSDAGAYTRIDGRFTTSIPGLTSGKTILQATAAASGTLSFPAETGTLITQATTKTLTNTTYDTAGTGNSLSIAGVAVTANNGAGPMLRETNPIITGGQHNALTSFGLRSTGAAFDLKMASAEVFTGNHTLTWSLGNADRTLTLGGNATLNGGTHSGTNTGDQTITLTGDVNGSGTGSFAASIGATKVTSAMLNADVFSTAHNWGGQQTFVAPVLGTPASGVGTNLTGTASGLTAGNVTTNANLTGPITSVGNATSIASQTGTGTKFVMDTAPAIAGGSHDALTSLGIRSTGAAFDLKQASAEVLSANRTLTWVMGDAARTITLGGSPTLNGGTHSGTNTGDQTITLTGDVTGSGTGSFASTIGATKVTSAMLNSDVFSTAHSWSGAQSFNSLVSVSATAGIGYATGAGGTVTQATSKVTGVTLNKVTGQITMNNAALVGGTAAFFIFTNSTIAANDLVQVQVTGGYAAIASYRVQAEAISAGQCWITLTNQTAGLLSEAVILTFAVIKSATS